MNPQMLSGDLGGRELILIAAIVLLMVGVSRLTELQRAPATVGSHHEPDEATARAYLDRLVGPASSRARPATPGAHVFNAEQDPVAGPSRA